MARSLSWSNAIHFLPPLVLSIVATFAAGIGFAQVPIPIQEQVQLFNSLPPAQQQALIRELQRSLPPAQRDAIVSTLMNSGGGGGGGGGQGAELDTEATDALNEALQGQELTPAFGEEPEPRLAPRDTVVVQFQVRPEAPPSPVPERRENQLEGFARGNPYRLDDSGRLLLPGVPAISLAGLNVDEATVRLQAEPGLRDFTVVVTRLPLEPVGIKALQLFGSDLFRRGRARFSPTMDIPIPTDYVIGPGDTINIQLFGNENTESFLPVSREGTINFPEIGPISVLGLSFDEMRNLINERVSQQMIGTRASITLGELRSIRVFVLGDVERPGTYPVSGLTTITNALFESGGIKPIGSLRNVALMRNGATIAVLDFYDLLLRGDTRTDVRLQSGDAIFVPPIGPTVAVDGEVRRPAIYEVKSERSVADLIALAGGLNANANRAGVKLERVVPNRGQTAEDIDVTTPRAQTPVRDGDVIHVLPNLDQLENSVRLAGNVFREGVYNWFPGMRLRDLIPGSEVVRPMTDLNYVLIRREAALNVDTQVLSADLAEAWRNPSGPSNIALEPRDTVHLFNVEEGRQHIVDPLIEELKAQAGPNVPLPVVRVGGQVRASGDYPLERDMHVSDLLRAGGGLSEAAYAQEAELTRYMIVNGEYRETELMTVDLAAIRRGDRAADLPLSAYDFLSIKEVSRWRGEEFVTLVGEVVFPGTYPIRRGETLSSVLQRAGGLTTEAFAEGSVFTRLEIAERQREQLEALARRVERDLATVSITDPNVSNTITTGQSLIEQLRGSVATGRLVIRLDQIVAGVVPADVVLKGGDRLLVPDLRQEVGVLGEVQYETAHLFQQGLSSDDYIAMSGGLTQRADKKRIYVVRANGEVVANQGGRWFSRGASGNVRPGDTVVVPLDLDQPLARWAAITQIIYQFAIAAAAVSSFD